MTDEVFLVLKAAVNLARDENIHSAAALRSRLDQIFPGQERDVREAIYAWVCYECESRGVRHG